MGKDQKQETTRDMIPVLIFKLSGLLTIPQSLDEVPTYIANGEFDGHRLMLQGKLAGQPFNAAFPSGAISLPRRENDTHYLRLYFPQQKVGYYERLTGSGHPTYAINYADEKAEERDEKRKRVFSLQLRLNNPRNKFVFDSDAGINNHDLERLKTIAEYIKPTVVHWHDLGTTEATFLQNSRGQGTLDSLVIPQSE